MSKISEQKALEAYPIAYYRNGGGIDDANASDRAVYEEGYDQAFQDFLEKACEWLEPTFKRIAGYYCGGDLMNDFENYMKDDLR